MLRKRPWGTPLPGVSESIQASRAAEPKAWTAGPGRKLCCAPWLREDIGRRRISRPQPLIRPAAAGPTGPAKQAPVLRGCCLEPPVPAAGFQRWRACALVVADGEGLWGGQRLVVARWAWRNSPAGWAAERTALKYWAMRLSGLSPPPRQPLVAALKGTGFALATPARTTNPGSCGC